MRTPILPAHIEETVQAIAKLHAEHYERATPVQRLIERVIAFLGRPAFAGVLTAVILSWIGANLAAMWTGFEPVDPPPFAWLQGAVAVAALYMTTLILTTQRRDDELAGYREQLTLELAMLGEQKSAKIIRLLEEMRRDDPLIENREDQEATLMSTPSDPESVLEAIKDSHDEAVTQNAGGRARVMDTSVWSS